MALYRYHMVVCLMMRVHDSSLMSLSVVCSMIRVHCQACEFLFTSASCNMIDMDKNVFLVPDISGQSQYLHMRMWGCMWTSMDVLAWNGVSCECHNILVHYTCFLAHYLTLQTWTCIFTKSYTATTIILGRKQTVYYLWTFNSLIVLLFSTFLCMDVQFYQIVGCWIPLFKWLWNCYFDCCHKNIWFLSLAEFWPLDPDINLISVRFPFPRDQTWRLLSYKSSLFIWKGFLNKFIQWTT